MSKTIKRPQFKVLKERALEPLKFIQVVSGPRQVGKTTMIQQLIDELNHPVHFASADAVLSSELAWIDQQWQAARILAETSKSKWSLLVIDEIQKISNWSEVVKKNWDQDRRKKVQVKVILSGSSAFLIDRGTSDSLFGRYEIIKLPHWSFNEMKSAFGFSEEEYVWFGGYPGAASLVKNEKRWKDYILNSIVEATISKDILSLTPIQKPAILKNLFELSSAYSGQILSYTKILGQLNDAGNTVTLTNYQNLLDRIWLISGMQKYSGSQVSTKSSIPKWMVYNTAFMSVYSDINFKQALKSPEVWGRHVESAVGAYLLNQGRVNGFEVKYWRDGNDEIDFVITKGKKIIALEVKSGNIRVRSGMSEFTKKFKPYKSFLISNDSISWKKFLKLDIVKLFD